uniref:Subunit Y of preprotein-translocase n=1 Tax=Climaconeis sp. TaxID=2846830 RepID=A0A8F8SNZ0_9STRA|nr:subunit Y of preprotein-translocase [Climaconeis sp.]
MLNKNNFVKKIIKELKRFFEKYPNLDIIIGRLILTISVLFFIRIGTFFPIPGINQGELAFYLQNHSVAKNLVSNFSGTNNFILGIFTLNIFPFINASIFTQFLTSASPKLYKMQTDGDLRDIQLITQFTRVFTLIIAIIQSTIVALFLRKVLFNWSYILAFQVICYLTIGGIIVLWLSDIIKEYGLGNGTSVLISTNIILSAPNFIQTVISENSFTILFNIEFYILLIVLFICVCGMIFLEEGFKKINLISSNELNEPNHYRVNSYIPIKYTQSGIMPIIFTTSILVIPTYLSNLGMLPKISFFGTISPILYWFTYFLLVFQFSLFYSRISLNPKNVSIKLKKMNVAISKVKGNKLYTIRPGIQTAFYLQQILKRITFIGSIGLSILATLPNFLSYILGYSNLNSLSITSLLIVVGVVAELKRQIDSIYYSEITF